MRSPVSRLADLARVFASTAAALALTAAAAAASVAPIVQERTVSEVLFFAGGGGPPAYVFDALGDAPFAGAGELAGVSLAYDLTFAETICLEGCIVDDPRDTVFAIKIEGAGAYAGVSDAAGETVAIVPGGGGPPSFVQTLSIAGTVALDPAPFLPAGPVDGELQVSGSFDGLSFISASVTGRVVLTYGSAHPVPLPLPPALLVAGIAVIAGLGICRAGG